MNNHSDEVLLAVCLITYNHESFIRQAIDGILQQKFPFSWKLVIADDHSTDGTRDILSEYKDKHPDFIELILQKQNVGPARNWLDLIFYPNSKYIAYLEGDDFWVDIKKLNKQVMFLEENSHYSMSFHNVEILSDGKLLPSSFPKPLKEDLTFKDILAKHYIPSCSFVYRNSFVQNPLPSWFETAIIGDIPFQLMLAAKGPIKYHDEIMAVYRKNPNSVTHSKVQKKRGRATYIYVYRQLRKTLNGSFWWPLSYKIFLTRLGYLKDYLGLNQSLK